MLPLYLLYYIFFQEQLGWAISMTVAKGVMGYCGLVYEESFRNQLCERICAEYLLCQIIDTVTKPHLL